MTHLGGLLQPTFLTPLSLLCPEHGLGPWHLCTAPPFPPQLSRAAIHPTLLHLGSLHHWLSPPQPSPLLSPTPPTVRILSSLLHTFNASLCWIPKPSCGLQPQPHPLPLPGHIPSTMANVSASGPLHMLHFLLGRLLTPSSRGQPLLLPPMSLP